MTKKKRIVEEVVLVKKNNPLGAGRTAALNLIKTKYGISEGQLRALCLYQTGADYWN